MSKPRNPHPFEQYPSEHVGWDRKHFDYAQRTWSLLVINREDEQSSMISEVRGRSNAMPWPQYHHMNIDGLLTVDGAVAILSRVFAAYDDGALEGIKEARAGMRRTLGL